MQVQLELYGPFKEAAGRKHIGVDLSADATVGDLLAAVVEEHPELADGLLDEGSIARSATVTVEGTPVAREDGTETPLSDGTLVRVSPPIKGGSPPRPGPDEREQ